ncbi:membrane protein [Nonomuraea sp. TT08I-71]|nr:membrane protein [Nonomuraea sp. TT08I-71]
MQVRYAACLTSRCALMFEAASWVRAWWAEFAGAAATDIALSVEQRTEMVVQPTWLVVLAWASLFVVLASTAVVAVDQFVLGYRQPARIMEMVWPATALYLGPVAVLTYRKWGRPQSRRWLDRYGDPPKASRHAPTTIQTYHCATHCTLGVIVATPITYGVGFEIFGSTLWPEVIGDYMGAVAIGVAFRYSAEAHAGGRRAWVAIRKFLRSDLLTVSVFEFALVGWLALIHLHVFHETLRPNSPVFWFIIQVGLVIGFFAAWPPTMLLIRRGVKTDLLGTPQ